MPTLPPGAPRPARRRPDRYHHGDLRRALLLEAVRTIHAHGAAALTLRGVGDRLGVSRTALYRHFADKQALLHEVAAEGFRMLRAALMDAWGRGGRRGFDAMGRAYVQFAIDHPSHYRVMFGGGEAHEAPPRGPRRRRGRIPGAGRRHRQPSRPPVACAATTPSRSRSTSGRSCTASRMLALDGLLPPGTSPEALAAFSIARLHDGIDAR